ncbi:hypothetical protein BJ912DRAFT_1058808 [Pholiota molesta]|nr:hypothetical protein BJ912DRAFT_1058808 [Pholiota molesta]
MGFRVSTRLSRDSTSHSPPHNGVSTGIPLPLFAFLKPPLSFPIDIPRHLQDPSILSGPPPASAPIPNPNPWRSLVNSYHLAATPHIRHACDISSYEHHSAQNPARHHGAVRTPEHSQQQDDNAGRRDDIQTPTRRRWASDGRLTMRLGRQRLDSQTGMERCAAAGKSLSTIAPSPWISMSTDDLRGRDGQTAKCGPTIDVAGDLVDPWQPISTAERTVKDDDENEIRARKTKIRIQRNGGTYNLPHANMKDSAILLNFAITIPAHHLVWQDDDAQSTPTPCESPRLKMTNPSQPAFGDAGCVHHLPTATIFATSGASTARPPTANDAEPTADEDDENETAPTTLPSSSRRRHVLASSSTYEP